MSRAAVVIVIYVSADRTLDSIESVRVKMVLFVPCTTSSIVSSLSTSTTQQQDFCYELTTSTTTNISSDDGIENRKKSQPIPVRGFSNSAWRRFDDHSTCPLERLPSPLATSAESVGSIKSSCSSRSSAEREVERAQRRELLDVSLGKLRNESNMPLRKHLLVFNTVKALQRDLDMLDDEELYCSLVGIVNEPAVDDRHMEVDECNWFVKNRDTSTMAHGTIGAPPKREELVDESRYEPVTFGNEFEMEDVNESDTNILSGTNTWSWTNENSFFDSFHESRKESSLFGLSLSSARTTSWLDSMTTEESNDDHLANVSLFGLGGQSAWSLGDSAGFDLWGAADPLGSARIDMQHLFPSQLLLQA
ncbi:unnamed protein product [Caenorhabditis bovis]|uniref:SERTA domain-containing protein n=1 Tax=Caenorhabditis bovis TaxID=2654633 RepID=A0A8S1EAH4_9PELO|nr:unnamed protein product [Caenorhabditis bovis]